MNVTILYQSNQSHYGILILYDYELYDYEQLYLSRDYQLLEWLEIL